MASNPSSPVASGLGAQDAQRLSMGDGAAALVVRHIALRKVGVMTGWEYSEVEWTPESNHAVWHRASGERTHHEQSGLEVLRLASQDGWEVIGYRSLDKFGSPSFCLLRRLLG